MRNACETKDIVWLDVNTLFRQSHETYEGGASRETHQILRSIGIHHPTPLPIPGIPPMTGRYTPHGIILTSQTTTIRPALRIGIKTLAVLLKTFGFATFASVLVCGAGNGFGRRPFLITLFLFHVVGRDEFTPKRTWVALEDGTHGVTAGIDVFVCVVASLASAE